MKKLSFRENLKRNQINRKIRCIRENLNMFINKNSRDILNTSLCDREIMNDLRNQLKELEKEKELFKKDLK